MKPKRTGKPGWRAGQCVLLALGLSLTAAVQAGDDLLTMPALPASRAEHSLQVDLARAGSRLVSVGERGNILFSDDQGLHWQQARVPVSVMLTAVTFSTDKLGWAVGHDGVVLQSDDAGASWRKVLDGNQLNQLAVEDWQQQVARLQTELAASQSNQVSATVSSGDNPQAEQTAADTANDAADLQTTLEDAEAALDDARAAVSDGPGNPLLDVLFVTPEIGMVVGAYGQIARTEDGGKSWHSWQSQMDNPDHNHYNALVRLDSGRLLLAGEAGLLMSSDDQGSSWQRLDSPYEGSYFGLLSAGADTYLLGLRGHVFVSEDQGDSWQPVKLDTALTTNAGLFSDGQLAIVGNSGLMISGQPGQPLTTATLPGRRTHSAIAAVPGYWVVAGEGGLTRIARTQP
ncbi:YCF48-related protein [Pokkaliibacter sp. MBI-7]|uniref:WD40/YVTN/BNR-like repeat-containing protein n=1 Tax=Pokkaliibacter sp. MBI-7 TaxID=3040600 RepID=UPI0024486BE2|nr:YCF48-related protein [Pokkaliibacter sp. MBI-7]MDH2433885.1 YCF48-related protein [Pokkaliibacter sp. MBI-7]